ncbi:MAG: hypothetical protein CFE24_08790 [Flavobacterium sp. BFFFF2]|nr:MAG: hypothetical protein CFE24_08790 [Flavobacterium sp. BFFFF2]
MKKILLSLVLALVQMVAFAQSPYIEWQKTLGGTSDEYVSTIQPTSDGGYIMAGYTRSTNLNVSGNHGGNDAWIVKLGASGTILWQKCLGGTSDDYASSIQSTPDGGFIMVGYTQSNDGDVTGNHGSQDAWVVKLTGAGNLTWQKTFGGTSYDSFNGIQLTSDGGYVVSGSTTSFDGDVIGNHGGGDAWVAKLSTTGTLVWQNCLGGSNQDGASSIKTTPDGGYILACLTQSTDGDVIGNHGFYDFWVVKLSTTGNLQWQACFGGTHLDIPNSIQTTPDGGYVVAGNSWSTDGDVTGNHGRDAWIVKLSATGVLQWEKAIGGTGNESAQNIQLTNEGSYIVAGQTNSTDGDVSGNHGETDFWAVKLSSTGNLVWQKTVGGTSSDSAISVQITTDGGYLLAGNSDSNDGDVSGNHGRSDCWIVKLSADPTPTPTANAQTLTSGSTVASLVATGSNLQWYAAATGGTVLTTSTVLSTGTYYVSQTVGGVESARTSVAVTIVSYTAIPDANFEQALFDLGIDTVNGDHQVVTSAISGVTSLSLSNSYGNLSISDLTGLEDFTSLQSFSLSHMEQLTSLNLSGYLNLQSVVLYDNNMLTNINVSGCLALTSFNSYENRGLLNLNLSNCFALKDLNCTQSQLSTLNVSGFSALETLNCTANILSTLNVSGCSSLKYLECLGNNLSGLGLGALTNLQTLSCGFNQITSLNLSGLTNLQMLDCSNNPNLSCITVSNPTAAAANANWTKDATASYSTNCNVTAVPTASSQTFCTGATVANLVATGSSLKWYAAQSGGTALTNSTVLTTTTYFVSQTLNAIESARTAVSVTINTTPALASQSYFLNGGIALSSVPGYGSSYNVYASANAATALPATTVLTSGTYYATQTQNGCESTRSMVTVVVYSLTSVSSPACGSRLNAITAPITATAVANATNYLFEVTGNGSTRTIYSATNSFDLTQLQGTNAYNTAYSIRVAAGFNGQYGDFGAACSLTTPSLANTTQVISSQCGGILGSMTTPIYCGQIVNAQAYRFEFTFGGVSRTLDSTTNNVQINNLSGGVAYGTPYSVRVAAQVSNTWQTYGATCTVTTPAASTQVRTNQCGSTLAGKWSILYCSAVTGATAYRFEWTNGGSTLTYTSSLSNMQLGNYTGWALNTTYSVRVAVQFGGTWQAYGSACNVKTPATLARGISENEVALSIKAIPNPFESEYVLMAQGGNQTPVQVSVYDMLGKQVEQFSAETHELENRSLGTNYASGIYNVMISQGDDQQVVRIIKK